jgi:hypothetical protein
MAMTPHLRKHIKELLSDIAKAEKEVLNLFKDIKKLDDDIFD